LRTPDEINLIVKRISKVVGINMMAPRGRKMTEMQEYLHTFSDEQLEMFLQKLATSKYVQNQYFSLDQLKRDDVVGSLLVGGFKEKAAISKYYDVNVIQRKTFTEPIVRLPEFKTKTPCPNGCGEMLVRIPIFQPDSVQMVTKCNICDSAKLQPLRERMAMSLTNHLTGLGVPKRFLTSSFDTTGFKPGHLATVRDMGAGFYFYGESGCGKTHQLISWMKYAITLNLSVAYIDWSEFLCKIRANSTSYYDSIKEYRKCDVLFVDDFKVGTSYIEEYSYNFINDLYKSERTAFFTSCTLPHQDQFAMRIGQMTKQYEIQRI